MKKNTLLILLLILTLSSCERDADQSNLTIPESNISLSSFNIFLSDAKGDDESFKITSNTDWKINIIDTEGVVNWMEVSPMQGGAGESTITITAKEANNTGVARSGYLDIISGKKTIKVCAIQKQNDVLGDKIANNIVVSSEGGNFEITFETNINEVEVFSKPEWIKEITRKSVDEITFTFKADPLVSDTEYERNGDIIFIDDISSKILKYTVSQWPEVSNIGDGDDAEINNLKPVLEARFGENYQISLPSLKISGTMNQADFSAIKSIPNLDLSKVTIVGKIIASTDEEGGSYTRPGNAIPQYAFEGTKLVKFIFPKNITYIGEKAFFSCYNLIGSITIPRSVTNIGSESFANCSKLSDIIVTWTGEVGSKIPSVDSTVFPDQFKISEGISFINIPAGKTSEYNAAGWDVYNLKEKGTII